MTFYSEIFDFFFNKISDYDLLENLSDKEIIEMCNKYLKSAIAHFTSCKKDLSKRDDNEQMFLIALDELEIEILSNLMVVEWIRPYIANRLNLVSVLGDKDFKLFSQANQLKALIELKEKLQIETERLMMGYSWNNCDFGKLVKKK